MTARPTTGRIGTLVVTKRKTSHPRIKTALLLLTILLAVGLSLGMWIVGTVPFNARTFGLHVFSIYLGIAVTLLYQHESQARKALDRTRDLPRE